MRNIIISFIFIGFASSANAQSMKEQLHNMVSKCYDMWKSESDVDENGKPIEFGHIRYDVANGYVETVGSWPPCGCRCESKAAAFKDVNGQYTYLKYETFECEDFGKSIANRPIHEVMPDGFGLESFIGHQVDKPQDYSFQLMFKIPQHGTDMKVHLRVLPLGLLPNDVNGLTYSSTEYNNSSTYSSVMCEIAQEIDNSSLLLLTEGKYGDLPTQDKQKIDNLMSRINLKSMLELCECAVQLKKLYDIYMSLECLDMTLKWNKERAKFEIKSKGTNVTPCAFAEFLTKVARLAILPC